VASALTSFVTLPWWLATVVVTVSVAQFISYVALRRLRLWSVYLFFGPVRVLSLTLPIVLFLVAWYPNRSVFT
jgi:hypothetical protein